MENYKWFRKNKNQWAVAILRFAYYLTGILSILLFITPFYILFTYLWPHGAYLLSGSVSLYLAVIAVFYAICMLIVTAALVVLHGLGEKYLLQDEV